MVFCLNIFDVVALGELLVDFTGNGTSSQDNPVFEANPGGAPCNVLAMLQHLGKKTAFIGKVGDDSFGRMLKDVVEGQGIDTRNVVMDSKVPTTLAFVHTAPDGDRSFSFYRNPGADMMLRKEEINYSLLKNTRLFHFGSLSMTDTGAEEATKEAVKLQRTLVHLFHLTQTCALLYGTAWTRQKKKFHMESASVTSLRFQMTR